MDSYRSLYLSLSLSFSISVSIVLRMCVWVCFCCCAVGFISLVRCFTTFYHLVGISVSCATLHTVTTVILSLIRISYLSDKVSVSSYEWICVYVCCGVSLLNIRLASRARYIECLWKTFISISRKEIYGDNKSNNFI